MVYDLLNSDVGDMSNFLISLEKYEFLASTKGVTLEGHSRMVKMSVRRIEMWRHLVSSAPNIDMDASDYTRQRTSQLVLGS